MTGARSADSGVGASPLRSRLRAVTGKVNTDNSPAKTKAAPVTGEISPNSTPICDAVTMNGNDVACSRRSAGARR
jgi:hypothetical protein